MFLENKENIEFAKGVNEDIYSFLLSQKLNPYLDDLYKASLNALNIPINKNHSSYGSNGRLIDIYYDVFKTEESGDWSWWISGMTSEMYDTNKITQQFILLTYDFTKTVMLKMMFPGLDYSNLSNDQFEHLDAEIMDNLMYYLEDIILYTKEVWSHRGYMFSVKGIMYNQNFESVW